MNFICHFYKMTDGIIGSKMLLAAIQITVNGALQNCKIRHISCTNRLNCLKIVSNSRRCLMDWNFIIGHYGIVNTKAISYC